MILDWMMVEGLAIGSRKKMPNSERSGNIRHLNLPRRRRTRIDPVTRAVNVYPDTRLTEGWYLNGHNNHVRLIASSIS